MGLIPCLLSCSASTATILPAWNSYCSFVVTLPTWVPIAWSRQLLRGEPHLRGKLGFAL